ncbi:MAG: HD-GYP domain-containing protein [Candidatus Nitrospinota bacterium M3_3B_026]
MSDIENAATPVKALVVDDEVITCDLLSRYLRKEGYEAEVVNDGVAAVERVKEGGVDVVLLDIRMPGLSGVEALKVIRSIDEEVVVIMLTAVDDVDTALETVREGADEYLRKPLMLPDLKRAITTAMEKKRLRRENQEYQKRLEDKVAEQTSELREMNVYLKESCVKIVRALSEAIEAKDPYTKGHCRRVTELSLRLGGQIGLSAEEMEALEYGALLHDIGKIGVRDSVLGKPGRLTEEEYEHIKQHPVIGDSIVGGIDYLKLAASVIRNHHERYDGKGYPDGLDGSKLSALPKILVITDAFDAMTSPRPYRGGMSTERALSVLREESGAQFDPELVELFIEKKLYKLDV